MKKLREKTPQSDIVPLRLDEENEEFWKGDERLRLSRKPFAMLRLLVERRPKWVSKDDFYNEIWKPKDEDVMDWTFTTYVHDIRKALGDETKPHRYIETRANKGYRFIGSITHSEQPNQSPEANAEHPVASVKPIEFELTPDPRPPIPYVVGRERELERLHKWFDRALAGERQLIFITGEPGIGKTTLVRTFLREVATKGAAVIGRGQCIEQYGPGEAYRPVLEAIGRLARDPRGGVFVEWMKQHTPAWLVQMPTLLNPTELAEVQRKVPGATQERMLREMSEGLEVLTEQIPFILVLEDLHWSDVSTLDLLSSLAQRTESARLLIIGTYRPEEGLAEGYPLRAITQELQGHRQCEELVLSLLSEAAVREYLQQRFPAAMLPTRLPETLHRNTEGSPLFVTAAVDDLLERGVIRQIEGRWVLQGPVDALVAEVPVSIRQLLTRQIDRLNEKEQQIMQAASVAGQEFSCAAVAAAVGIDTADVEACCEILVRRQQFLRRAGVSEWPDGVRAARYGFRHALYQYLWNERLPFGQRQQFHTQIGERLESAYGDRASEIATELAVHFEQGRDYVRAIRYLQQAAQNAVRRSAHQEVIGLLTKGLGLLKTQPDTSERYREELEIQTLLGLSAASCRGYAAPDVEQIYRRARELCQQLGNRTDIFPVVRGLCTFYMVRDDQTTARELAEQCLHFAQESQRADYLMEGHTALGYILCYCGDLDASRVQLEQCLTLYESHRENPPAFLTPQDPGVACLALLSIVLWLRGYPDQALRCSQDALTLARQTNRPFNVAYAHVYSGVCRQLRRESQEAAVHERTAVQISTEYGFDVWLGAGTLHLGIAQGTLDQPQEALALIIPTLAAFRATGAELFRPYFLAGLAEAHRAVGQFDEARAALNEALDQTVSTHERFYQAELYRLRGELSLAQDHDGQEEAAEADFLRAIEIAQGQQAKMLELRATISLYRLRSREDRGKTVRATLTVLYNWFTEGFETSDLQEAKALLAMPLNPRGRRSRT